MISLLAPLGLAALAAWCVPLLIHWVRRSDRQVILFAAMRYLSPQVHPRERLRLHEPWLLLLRLLLLAVLALLLAVPILRTQGAASAPWVLVAPSVPAATARAAVSAPLAAWHWLAPGFPSLDTPPPPLAAPGTAAPLSSLLRQADLELPPRAALTIVVPDELGGLDAERVRLTHPFTWRVLPGADRTVVSGAPSRANAPLLLAVRTDAQSGVELPLVRALAAAWQIEGENIQWDIATADAPLPATSAWLIWLAGPLPPGIDAWVRRGGTVLASRQTASGGGAVVLSEASGAALLRERQLGLGRVVSLAGPLRVGESATLSSAEFPHTVLALLRGPPPVPERAAAVAVTPLAAGHAPLGAAHALLPYLALIVALLFLGERLLASRARVRA